MKKIFKNTEIFFQKNNITMESGKITTRIIKGIYTALYSIGIIALFIGYNFKDSPPPSGWYLQTMPNLGGKQILDITFPDSLNGIAVARQTSDTSYILRTTNGGDNWAIIYRSFLAMERIQFLNTNTGYAVGAYLFKTTNGGYNWNQVSAPPISPENLWVHDENTIWIISTESLTGGVFRTTNGGQSWTQQLSAGSQNPDKIYMYNARIGFIVRNSSGAINLRKTTNGGDNWFTVVTGEGFYDMKFIDSLTGWRAWGNNMYKTENGGLNWITQPLPSGGILITSGIYEFNTINSDTVWGAGGYVFYGNGIFRGVVYRTTNGGNDWYYQIPDTSIHIFQYYHSDFINKYYGWAYSINNGIHTLTGGDTTFYTKISQASNEVPKEYLLEQNYPNPFNSITIIKFKVQSSKFVKIVVYDLPGREVRSLVNEFKQAGTYQVRFDAEGLPSGVYFYSLLIDGKNIDTKKLVLLK